MTSPPLGTGWGGMPSGVCELLFSHRTSIAYTGDVYLDRLHRRCGSGPPAVQADLERVFVLDRGTLDGQPRYFPELTGVLDKAWRFEIPL
jgi:hypothetical protein